MSFSPKAIETFSSPEVLYDQAAKLVLAKLVAKPTLRLGLAAGNTPTPLYARLMDAYKKGLVSFAEVEFFALDEFIGLGPQHPSSFAHYFQTHFFSQIDADPKKIHLLNGANPNGLKACQELEKRIADSGGIDLQILGLGLNGHIGFNEPGSPVDSVTRVVNLTAVSRQANAARFKSVEDVPVRALTMGISTIMKAKEILLLAVGAEKAPAVENCFKRAPTLKWPASVLQKHKATQILVCASPS